MSAAIPAAFAAYDDVKPNMITGQKVDLMLFLHQWIKEGSRYEEVAGLVDAPAELVAAIHWRESSGSFTDYLLQGDRLGEWTWADGRSNEGQSLLPDTLGAVYYGPDDWKGAAVFAFKAATPKLTEARVTRDTRDINNLCEFATLYNGTGYRKLGVPDPYVLAGTNAYEKGKYTGDGHYDPNATDHQVGCLLLLRAAFNGSL